MIGVSVQSMVLFLVCPHKFAKCSGKYSSVLQKLFLTDFLKGYLPQKCIICLELKHLSYSNVHRRSKRYGRSGFGSARYRPIDDRARYELKHGL